LTTRELNRRIKASIEEGVDEIVIKNPSARHNIAVGVRRPCKITIEGSVGYYAATQLDGPEISIEDDLDEHYIPPEIPFSREDLAKILGLEPLELSARFQQGKSLLQIAEEHGLTPERLEEAVNAYQRVFAIKPDAYRAHVGRASALMKLGREREAEEHFEAALELRPDLYSAHQALARLCRKRGERAAAIAHYQAMIAIAPGNLTGHFLMGSALEAAGRRRAALAHYRNALAIDPDHKEARRAAERIEGARANPSARSRGGEHSSPP